MIGGDGGKDGGGGGGSGEGEGGGGEGEGGGGEGGEGGEGGRGGGAGQVETVPERPFLFTVGQEQTVAPPTTLTFDPWVWEKREREITSEVTIANPK